MGISINNDAMLTSSMAKQMQKASSTSKLEAKLADGIENSTDQELMDVCESFESYMVEQMFKQMRSTVPKSEEENPYVDYFGDMMYEEYATNVAKNGELGIAQMLYDSMKRNMPEQG